MGNSQLLSEKNSFFNKSNIYKEQNYNNDNYNNINKNFYNSNNITNLGHSQNNNNKKNSYLFGYHQKSNKKIKYENNPKKLTRTKSHNKAITNIKKYTLFFLPKYTITQTNDRNQMNNEYKKNNYMKKY